MSFDSLASSYTAVVGTDTNIVITLGTTSSNSTVCYFDANNVTFSGLPTETVIDLSAGTATIPVTAAIASQHTATSSTSATVSLIVY